MQYAIEHYSDNTLMRNGVNLTDAEDVSQAIILFMNGGRSVESIDGETWESSELLRSTLKQARLAAVYADHAATIDEFAAAWAKTSIEAVPDSWAAAIALLKSKYASLTTTEEKLEHMSTQQELITLRFGPLANVWDDVIVILNTPQNTNSTDSISSSA